MLEQMCVKEREIIKLSLKVASHSREEMHKPSMIIISIIKPILTLMTLRKHIQVL